MEFYALSDQLIVVLHHIRDTISAGDTTLRDMKASFVVETMTPPALSAYAQVCGWTLARTHARSGDPIAIASYLGTKDRFDRSITEFSERYADQNAHDYDTFTEAVRAGRLPAVEGV